MSRDPENKDTEPVGGVRSGQSQQPAGPPGWLALVGIGFEFLGIVVAGGAVGWFVDRHLNSFPWLTLLGGAFGFAAGLMMMVRAARTSFKD